MYTITDEDLVGSPARWFMNGTEVDLAQVQQDPYWVGKELSINTANYGVLTMWVRFQPELKLCRVTDRNAEKYPDAIETARRITQANA